MLLRSLAAAAVLAAGLHAGALSAQPAPYLTGRVIDGDTGQAVADATVHLHGRHSITIKTGPDGRYQSDTLVPGMYTLTVTAEGYLPAVSLYADRVPLRLRVREDGIGPAIVRKDWMLERAAHVRGRVLTDSRAPLESITVIAAKRIRTVDGWPELDIRSSTVTGADGSFRIGNLARGAYILAYQLPVGGVSRWIYSPGIIDPRHATQVEASTGGAEAVDLESAAVPFPSVPVSTVTPGGAPAGNTAVEIEVWNPFISMSRSQTISTVTDSSGRGTLERVPVGRHHIRARSSSTLTAPASTRAAGVLEIPTQLAAGVQVRMRSTTPACLLTRWEQDGARPEDLRALPLIRASTRDGVLDQEMLDARAPLGDMIRLQGLLPESLLTVAPHGQGPSWVLTRFSPAASAPEGRVPIASAAAGCTAVYFRRISESIRGRVILGDSEWVPDVAVIATPIDAPAAPIAVSAMTDDGTFHIAGIALGLQYEVVAVPAGIAPDLIPAGLRHVIKSIGGNVISIPLSLPIAR